MISRSYVRTMQLYSRWMNDRLHECCGKLSDAERKRNAGAFFKSIHGTFDPGVTDLIWLPELTDVSE